MTMKTIDILNREDFVHQLLRLTENISANKSSTCFAINGAWGCGKTFILDMFQEQLEQIQSEETAQEKYFVIRYDCWKFDYYEEPLIAIVSSMISTIEEKTKLFPESEKKSKLLGILKAIGVSLLSMSNSTIKEKTGIDVKKAYDIIREGSDKGTGDWEDDHSYDVYFAFNRMVQRLSDLSETLAEDYTVVFLVDELDRCLPKYAIKVLERLHHLTEGDTNIITVISIDKQQLMQSVRTLFGFDDPSKYLEKFISFEVKLDYGKVSERVSEKYADYFALFDKEIFPFEESVEECIQWILKDIDARTQEQLMDKAMLVHKLLYSDKKDYSFLCMEILLTVMRCVYKSASINWASFDSDSFAHSSASSPNPAFLKFFKEKFDEINFKHTTGFNYNQNTYVLPEKENLYGALLYTGFWMYRTGGYPVLQRVEGGVYEVLAQNHKELQRFDEAIKTIS